MVKQHSHVLVVDDNEMSRNLIKYRLEMDGIDVVPLSSGEEALDAVAQGPVSLIFLDLLMDGLSGLDVLKTLKADVRYHDIHVVIVSGVEDVTFADAALTAGAADFLPKPVTASTLSEIIADLLPTATVDAGVKTDGALDAEACRVFDLAPSEQLVKDYGVDIVNGFIARFQDLAPKQLSAVITAMAGDATDEWRRDVSALKGGARTLGLIQLATACRIVERALDRKQSQEAAQATFALSDYLTAAIAALELRVTDK